MKKLPILRRTKEGKPYKNDLKNFRSNVKQNFDFYKSFEGQNLPPEIRGYYRQIDAAKEQAKSRFRNPETGRFFSKKENKIIEKSLKNFATDTGRNFEELKKFPDVVKIVYDAEVKREFIRQIPSDIIGDMVKDKSIKTIIIYDQNGNEKTVTPEQAIKIITDTNKRALNASGGFNPTNKTTLKQQKNASTKTKLSGLKNTLKIFVPNLKDESGKYLSDEEIQELLEELDEDYSLTYAKSATQEEKSQKAIAAAFKGKSKK